MAQGPKHLASMTGAWGGGPAALGCGLDWASPL